MDTQAQRKFYVLVPVYKAQKYLHACVDSVLQQNYGNFRLILVDDGSPDQSGEICDAYAAQDPRVSVIHKENGGQNSARNAAVDRMLQEASEEDFAVFLDSDDRIRPRTLQILNDTIDRSGCDMVVYGFDRVYAGKVLEHCRNPFVGQPKSRRELYRIVFFESDYNSLCRKAVSRSLIQKMREGYENQYDYIRLGEDLLQSIPLYEHCRKAVFISDNLYEYTSNPDSVSNNRAANPDFLDSAVRRFVQAFLEQQPEWTRADMDAYLRCCRKLLANNLRHIAKLKTSRQEKIKLFEKVKADTYYANILQTAGRKDVPLQLLKQGKYDLLLLHSNAYNLAASGKRAARRLLAR